MRINRDRGVTVVLAEHRTGRLFAEADRVIAMEDGRITVDASPAVAARALAGSAPWLLPPGDAGVRPRRAATSCR